MVRSVGKAVSGSARLGRSLLLCAAMAGGAGAALAQTTQQAQVQSQGRGEYLEQEQPRTQPPDPSQNASPASKSPAWQRVRLGRGDRQYYFPVYANHDLSGDLSAIRQVVFIFHGLQRNGDNYFDAGQKLLAASGRDPAEVLLLAPNYPGVPDKDKGFDGMPVWGTTDWAAGLDARGVGFDLSSFAVIDDLMVWLADRARMPELGTIIVAGHSAGGQLVQRYAALNRVDEGIRSSGMDVRYVVANPSSYLYFNALRPAGDRFADYDRALCPGYDDYRYGMQHMIPYAAGTNGQTLFKRYAYRAVTYLLGTADNDPNHRVIDKSCPAQAQGATRLARGRAYMRYERVLAGKAARIHHLAYEVNGVGHDQAGMFGSTCGLMALFQADPPAGFAGASCGPYLF